MRNSPNYHNNYNSLFFLNEQKGKYTQGTQNEQEMCMHHFMYSDGMILYSF